MAYKTVSMMHVERRVADLVGSGGGDKLMGELGLVGRVDDL